MHRVLVVDDEPHVVNGLQDLLVACTDLDLDVYTAMDGLQAYQLMQKTSFDLLISDIMMPNLDGIELMRKVKQFWPDCRVILFTGHADFDDLYSANKYQNVTYLLKSIDDDELLGFVRGAINDMEQKDSAEGIDEKIKQLVPEARHVLQQRLLTSFLQPVDLHEPENTAAIQTRLNNLEIPLEIHKPVLPVLCRSQPPGAAELPWAMLSMIRERSPAGLKAAATALNPVDGHFTILFQFTEEKNGSSGEISFRRTITNILDPIPQRLKMFDSLSLMIVTSSREITFSELSEKYEKLHLLLNSIPMEKGCIISEDGAEQILLNHSGQTRHLFDYHIFPELQLQLEAHDTGGVIRIIQSIMEKAKSGTLIHPQSKLEIVSALNFFLINYSSAKGIDFLQIVLNEQPKILSEYTDLTDELILADYAEIIRQIIEKETGKKTSIQSNPISLVCRHIDMNLGDDLSLIRLAEKVELNPSYLSRLFKQVMGETVLEYTNKRKIEQAKQFLTETNIRIGEISNAVGFFSPNYFSRFFKTATGMTPQQYRDNHT